MILITTITEIRNILEEHRQNGKSIGFIPTMGALHEGHMALVEQCVEECDITVTSIFVNPTQFNESSDLKYYPRTLESDLKLLEKAKCQIVFFPPVEEMYPPGLQTKVDLDFQGIDNAMEGDISTTTDPVVISRISSRLFGPLQATYLPSGDTTGQAYRH